MLSYNMTQSHTVIIHFLHAIFDLQLQTWILLWFQSLKDVSTEPKIVSSDTWGNYYCRR